VAPPPPNAMIAALLLLAALPAPQDFGQGLFGPPAGGPDPVQVGQVRFEPAQASPGETVELRVCLDVVAGWHVYHPDQNPEDGIPVSLSVTGKGLRTAGPLRALQQPVMHEELIGGKTYRYLWLDGAIELALPVVVEEGFPGLRQAEVAIGWQACDDSVCLPPERAAATAAYTLLPDRGWVSWSVRVDPPTARAGEKVRVHLDAEIDFEWHLYHPDQDPGLGVPVSIGDYGSYLKPAPGAKLRALTEPLVHVEEIGGKTSEFLWLPGPASFEFDAIAVAGKGCAPAVLIDWQTCDESTCNSPMGTWITLPLTVQAGASGAGGVDRSAAGGARSLPDGTAAAASAAGATSAAGAAVLGDSLWTFLLAAIAAALFSLATPCVFPMIPITVSFFTKRAEAGKGSALGNAAAYGLGIVFTFVGLGLGMTALFGAGGINSLASNPFLNIALAGLFLAFGLSLIGFFEIQAPRWLQARLSKATSQGQSQSGYKPVMLMGVAFSVVAFTCTVAFVGALLAFAASSGRWFYAALGMTVFAVVFAAPFFLLAMFPSALKKLPKAGGWMNGIKVVMGFVEIVAAWKFLSNADMVWDLELLTRPVIVVLTAVPLLLCALFLFGLLRTPHQFERRKAGLMGIVAGGLFAGLGVYVLLGLDGRPFRGALEAYFPPPHYGVAFEGEGSQVLGPADLVWYENYQEAFDKALAEGRMLFLDFTGVTCVNCRRMEGNVMPLDEVRTLLERFVRAELWVDKKPFGDWNKEFQNERFKTVQQPQYVVIDPRSDTVIETFDRYDPDSAKFAAFLRRGLEAGRDAALPQ